MQSKKAINCVCGGCDSKLRIPGIDPEEPGHIWWNRLDDGRTYLEVKHGPARIWIQLDNQSLADLIDILQDLRMAQGVTNA